MCAPSTTAPRRSRCWTRPRLDNTYFNNLRYNKGVLASDQVLFTDCRSRPTVNLFAANNTAFPEAFVAAMAKLGRIRLKTSGDGVTPGF
jgi:peroxidase